MTSINKIKLEYFELFYMVDVLHKTTNKLEHKGFINVYDYENLLYSDKYQIEQIIELVRMQSEKASESLGTMVEEIADLREENQKLKRRSPIERVKKLFK